LQGCAAIAAAAPTSSIELAYRSACRRRCTTAVLGRNPRCCRSYSSLCGCRTCCSLVYSGSPRWHSAWPSCYPSADPKRSGRGRWSLS